VAPAPSLIFVLRLPDVTRTLVASLLGRLPYTAVGLLMILRVREMGGSYAEGGLVVASFSLALALVLAGCFIAPAFATLYGMVPDLARAGTLTESYTWLTTGISIGVAAGSALSGALVAAGSSRSGLAMAAGLVALGALSLAGGRHRLGWGASVAAAA
jgi:hypothetical protein